MADSTSKSPAGRELDESAGWKARWRQFAGAEDGTQSIEVLLIFVAILIPCFASILLMQEVLYEYIEVETIILTSPFF